jgi:hypothetical protein
MSLKHAALYFTRPQSYPCRVNTLFSASYYYGFFGYNRWESRSRAR